MSGRAHDRAHDHANPHLVAGVLALAFLTFVTTGWAGKTFTDRRPTTARARHHCGEPAEDPAGALTVAIAVPNAPTLPPEGRIDLWFDLDSNHRTGDEGDEALARYTAGGSSFSRWDGDDLIRGPGRRDGFVGARDADVHDPHSGDRRRLELRRPRHHPRLRGDRGRGRRSTASTDPRSRVASGTPRPAPTRSPTRRGPAHGPGRHEGRRERHEGRHGPLRRVHAPVTARCRATWSSCSRSTATCETISGPVDSAEVLLRYTNGRLSVWRWDAAEYEWVEPGSGARAQAATATA